VIRDYQSGLDDGIYRCFATRRNSFGSGTETVYVETEVNDRQENGYFNGGRIPGGGFSGGGGCGIGGCNSFLDYVQQNTK